MRIFVATGIFHPEPGGPATYLYHLLPELQQRGHQVTVLTFGDAPTDAYPYPVTRISRHQSYLKRQWAYFRAALRLWSGHDLAFIHSLNIPLPRRMQPRVGKIVGDSAWERATNKGWIAPDVDVDSFQATRFDLRVELNKWQRARTARTWDHIIVPSKHRKQMVAGWGVSPERISVIYNALTADIYNVAQSQAETRSALGLPEDVPLLLTVARLTPLKGIDVSLQALAQVPDVHFVVVGDGPARQSLETLCTSLGLVDRVRFAGRIPHEAIPRYYRAADYTLLYSGGEGLSHVLLESLFAGTPAIASDAGGNPEVIHHHVNGLLVPYPNVDALTAALHTCIRWLSNVILWPSTT